METGQLLNNPDIEIKETDDQRLIYVNFANITASTFDFVFGFGQISTSNVKINGKTEALPVTLLTRIVMSPQHAKVFSKVLTENLNNYEKDFGQISIEPLKK
ncbi:MAG: DUF3467 domain-containing protein [Syntrophales bacterium]